MIRAALAIVALIFASPASAQDAEALRGVWQGTVGNLPVHACFDGEDNSGVYYYDAHRRPIRLVNNEGLFAEAIGWEEPGETYWQFSAIGGERASGTWSERARSLPIALRRVEWAPLYDYAGPCESAAFNQLRFEGGRIEASPTTLAGQGDYTLLRYVPPPHWNRAGEVEEISIASFALPETRYGDRRINHALGFYLPRGDARDAFAECMASIVAWNGTDGGFQQLVSPELITPRWLGLVEANSVYCGGAHPSHWQQRRVFDRNRGVEVDPSRWLTERALTRELYASGEDSDTFTSVTVEFREAIRAHWLADAEMADCLDIVMDATSWDIGLAREGLALIPSVPHVATMCAGTVVLPWVDAAPFLTAEGQAVRLSLEASD